MDGGILDFTQWQTINKFFAISSLSNSQKWTFVTGEGVREKCVWWEQTLISHYQAWRARKKTHQQSHQKVIKIDSSHTQYLVDSSPLHDTREGSRQSLCNTRHNNRSWNPNWMQREWERKHENEKWWKIPWRFLFLAWQIPLSSRHWKSLQKITRVEKKMVDDVVKNAIKCKMNCKYSRRCCGGVVGAVHACTRDRMSMQKIHKEWKIVFSCSKARRCIKLVIEWNFI